MLKLSKVNIAISCALLGLPLCSLAQTTPNDASDTPESSNLEVISVTATRRETTIQEVPYSISAYGGKSLQENGITDFSTLARNIPGLTLNDVGRGKNGISNSIFIRGINANASNAENFGSKTDPAVSVYLGETPMSANLELRDINRVEVLRGPQSTLYGSGSLSGTLRYIPNKPQFDTVSGTVNGKLAKNAESDGTDFDGDVVMNIPLSDTFAIRGVVAKLHNAGYIDADYLEGLDDNNQPTGEVFSADDINEEDVMMARIAARWVPSAQTDILLSHAYQKDDIKGSTATSEGLDGYNTGAKLIGDFEREVSITSLVIDHELGDSAMLTSSTSLTQNDATNMHDQSYGYAYQSFWEFYAGIPREVVRGIKSYKTDTFTQEVRVTGSLDNIDWLAGGYYAEQDYDETAEDYIYGVDTFYGITNPAAPDLGYRNIQATEFTDRAVFGELTYFITDEWQITGGLRYFDQDFYAFQSVILPPCGSFCGEGELGYSSGEGQRSFSDTLYRLNTSFDIDADTKVYLNIAQGFRHGGANGAPVDDLSTEQIEGGVYAEHPDYLYFDPDKTTNYELGAKGLLLNGEVNYSLAVFYIDWQDPILNFKTPNGGFPVMFNADEAESRGLELEVNAKLSHSVKLNLGWSYTEAELTEDFVQPNVAGGEASFAVIANAGDVMPGVPKNTVVASLIHSTEVLNGVAMNSRIGLSYKGSFITGYDSLSNDKIDSSTLLNASVAISKDDWTIRLFADNLTNRDDMTSSASDEIYSGEKFGLQYPDQLGDPAYRVRPRTIGVSASYSF
ncbi:TonB-dependent receptor [Alteromonas gilva]|uniref:TonB-dependent receptor n=1 Tax=Alteromonas gilva TaxID=2987522 RepID=A0ABT5L694_9ALTE|nr:TonB-dependent receptor [Alteromonas gilva]MDC8831924.1 TonB-dependent receptor [Alteromonas gilva]